MSYLHHINKGIKPSIYVAVIAAVSIPPIYCTFCIGIIDTKIYIFSENSEDLECTVNGIISR
jgi:hypothetical protein